ncbi:MAG: ComEA family DNA-binding protein [Steroidobacteraceae bacterium]
MRVKGMTAAMLAAILAVPAALAGPVNVNTADARALAEALEGVGLAKAEAIIQEREANGPFKDAGDLSRVKGLGAKTVERNLPNLQFGEESKK